MRTWFVFSLLLAIAFPASAQVVIPGYQALGPPAVNGTTLSVEKLNFSVNAPDESFQWYVGEFPEKGLTGFIGLDPETGRTIQVSVSETMRSLDDIVDARKYVKGIAEGMQEAGVVTGVPEVVAIDTPIKGAYRFTLPISSEQLASANVLGVFVFSGKIYTLTTLTTAEQSTEFDEFVLSFRFLKDTSPSQPE